MLMHSNNGFTCPNYVGGVEVMHILDQIWCLDGTFIFNVLLEDFTLHQVEAVAKDRGDAHVEEFHFAQDQCLTCMAVTPDACCGSCDRYLNNEHTWTAFSGGEPAPVEGDDLPF